jgi:asparagine synthetase B (glutamine-hydrolysing)
LPPGHYAIFCDDRFDVRRYWQPDFNREDRRPVEELRRELRD